MPQGHRFARSFGLLAAAGLVAIAAPLAHADAAATLRKAPASGLVLGDHEARTVTVVDGDTLRVGPGPAVRVQALDTEEIFHDDAERRAAASDFSAYARARRGESAVPVKFGTPAGEAARAFARDLLARAQRVRLEKDAAVDRSVDPFGRTLAHAVLVGDEGETLFAEAMVRAGHSPYFVKYGRSRRFDAALTAAEREARAAKRGIWGNDGPAHYPDYAERLAWWHARAEQVARWRALPPDPSRITLGVPEEDVRLASRVGRDVVVFADVRQVLPRDGRRPWMLVFQHRGSGSAFRVVSFDEAVWKSLDPGLLTTRYLQVRGTVSLYEGRPQIVVQSPEQITLD